ncbi:hypothetical protein THASP1DRAFT_28230 [Thamnocephalis sphaerospora]|uniref:Uncharacterized protein n=1 Tax=Thamnocephalis sphaerospora TaxID=78915 RepID=A0A4P9XUT3_9FUNG|nr:hypothetical protein THASP1DRAFT_28230 [Thamnocephalis sphaerospora]|eukprot:RKP10004.1 hypothetical protein THASP1DRAFT_28230 [Thamnocephalis sphaerospora]
MDRPDTQNQRRKSSLDLIITGIAGSADGPDRAIDLCDHTGVIEDRSHVDQHAYTSQYTGRFAVEDAETGAGFEPAVSQLISSPQEGGAGAHHGSERDASILELREPKDTPAGRINAGLREARKEHKSSERLTPTPLFFHPSGERVDSLAEELSPDNAQSFKPATYFGAGLGSHAADEQAFAHPLSATGRRRESVMLCELEQREQHDLGENAPPIVPEESSKITNSPETL